MAINFPTSPALNDTYSFGGRVWKWNGVAWESVSSNYGPTPTFTVGTVESGVDPEVTITGVAPDLTLNMVIPDPYEIAVDNGFVGTEAEWLDATFNLVNGVRITVSETAPADPETDDLWFW
jgi:hypothetical protein